MPGPPRPGMPPGGAPPPGVPIPLQLQAQMMARLLGIGVLHRPWIWRAGCGLFVGCAGAHVGLATLLAEGGTIDARGRVADAVLRVSVSREGAVEH